MIGEGLREALRRAYRRRGYERERVVLILRSVLASTLAYLAGASTGETSLLGFAPFTALLVVRPSVYGSVLQSGRYVAAVLAGAVLAGAVGLTVGAHTPSFALVVLVALIVGQVRFFGGQGLQLPIVAAFALAGGTASNAEDLGSLLAMVGIGAAAALVVNIVLVPTIRFRDAENAVLDLADELCFLTGEISKGVRDGVDGMDTRRWSELAEGLDSTVRNALESVRRQEDRARLNPRRLVSRRIDLSWLDVFRSWIHALSRSSHHVRSLVGTLRANMTEENRFRVPDESFLRELAPLLEQVSEVFAAVRDQQEPENRAASERLSALVERALKGVDERRARMRGRWDDDRWTVYSSLLTDTERVLAEVHQGYETTAHDGV
ncbi:aromatic acid exporter family protein [Nocardiopsis alba]|uniref:aromatic acid exporter family protein n=1 Tax=Nocardiopsis alba TaxID=53437 RepID=UPI0033A11EDD